MMRLPPFRYLAPRTLEEALGWKEEAGPASMFLAGGTDLYPNMKRRHQTPTVLISLRGIPELRGIGAVNGNETTGWLRIGACELLSDVAAEPRVRADYPALAEAVESISTPILRNMGTIGGNALLDTRCTYYNQNLDWRKSVDFCMKRDGKICWVAPASPRCWAVQSADTVPVLVALGARATLVSQRGERTVPAADLYRDDGIDYLTKAPEEILTALHLPPPNGRRAVYLKLRRRGAFDFPVLGVAAAATFGQDGVASEATVVLGGVGSHPISVDSARELLTGRRWDRGLVRAAAEVSARPARPLDNTDFTLAWRKEMVRVFVARALERLAGLPSERPGSAVGPSYG